MIANPSKLAIPRSRCSSVRWPVILAIAAVCAVVILLTYVYTSARRSIIGKVDPETGYRFAFTISPEWVPVQQTRLGFSKKRDDFTFSVPKPPALQAWFDRFLLHRTSNAHTYALLKEGISIVSGDQILSGNRSPFRNFELRNDYPMPKHPDFVDLPGTVVSEETHITAADQPALWRVDALDLPPSPALVGPTKKSSERFYTHVLVVKMRGRDLWFAVVGTSYEPHHRQIQNEVRAIGESLRIENVRRK